MNNKKHVKINVKVLSDLIKSLFKDDNFTKKEMDVIIKLCTKIFKGFKGEKYTGKEIMMCNAFEFDEKAGIDKIFIHIIIHNKIEYINKDGKVNKIESANPLYYVIRKDKDKNVVDYVIHENK